MKKVLIEVYVPALEKHFDALVPSEMKVGEACLLISNMIEEISDKNFRNDNAILCDKQGYVLENNKYVSDYNIKNADKLILI